MDIPSRYEPGKAEHRWYDYWMKHGLFRSTPDSREPYTIVIPPPNVTGVLHMGHMLNNTLQDVLIRKKRMEGETWGNNSGTVEKTGCFVRLGPYQFHYGQALL